MIRKIYNSLPQVIRGPIKKTYRRFYPADPERLMYRVELFNELIELSGPEYFRGKRILEIGPRDGCDSQRLSGLEPQELVMLDLPEKRAGNEGWLAEIECDYQYVEANFMYMSASEIEALGHFDLIWFTGVLYHNAEQLRMLRKLYKLLNVGGFLVLESSTLRGKSFLTEGAYVEIHYPMTHRDTGTVTHLPSRKAIIAWLNMVGFQEVHSSNCYTKYNRELIGKRYGCVAKKNDEDEVDSYYQKSGLNPKYPFGDSV